MLEIKWPFNGLVEIKIQENSVMKKTQILLTIIFSFILFQNTYSHVTLDYPAGGETFQGEEQVIIRWSVSVYHGPANWDLYFSDDGGTSWETIVLNLPENRLTKTCRQLQRRSALRRSSR